MINITTLFSAFQDFQAEHLRITRELPLSQRAKAIEQAKEDFKTSIGELVDHIDWTDSP